VGPANSLDKLTKPRKCLSAGGSRPADASWKN